MKARQRNRTETIGEKVKAGVSRDRARRTGRNPKFLFSGLLKCGKCGAISSWLDAITTLAPVV